MTEKQRPTTDFYQDNDKKNIWFQIANDLLVNKTIFGPDLSILRSLAGFFSPSDAGFYNYIPSAEIGGTIGVMNSPPCYDDVGKQAVDRMVANVMGGFFPEQDEWHNIGLYNKKQNILITQEDIEKSLEDGTKSKLAVTDEDLEDLRKLNKQLAFYRRLPSANFFGAARNMIKSAIIFGTGAIGVWRNDNDNANPVAYELIKNRDLFLLSDAMNKIIVVGRMKVFDRNQLLAEYNNSPVVRRILSNNEAKAKNDKEKGIESSLIKEFYVMKIVAKKSWYGGNENVAPNPDHKWNEVDILIQTGDIIKTGGYKNNPFIVARWSLRGQNPYGIGLAEECVMTAKMLNDVMRDNKIIQKQMAYPTMAVTDDISIKNFQWLPKTIVSGLITDEGKRKYEEVFNQTNLANAKQLLSADIINYRQQLKDSFMNLETEYQSKATGNPETATEVQQRTIKKMAVFANNFGQLRNDILDNLIEREFSILTELELINLNLIKRMMAGGNSIAAEFVSPLGRAGYLQSLERVGQFVQMMVGFAQITPEGKDLINAIDFENIASFTRQALSLPPNFMKSPEEIARLKAIEEQQKQQMINAEAAKFIGEANNQNAQAQATRLAPTPS